MKKYGIFCASRSGSSFLCDLLTSTNRCGKPQEFFNKSLFTPMDKDRLLNQYKTDNDVFGAKIVGINQLNLFKQSGIKLTHFIHLYREDVVLQAISAFIADKTNGWHKETKPPEYNFDAITWYINDIIKNSLYIPEYLNSYTNVIDISYENDLCTAPEQTVVSILNYMDINTDEVPIKITTRFKKPKEPNLTWKQKYLEELKKIKEIS